MRPATDEKFFAGKVCTQDEFQAWWQDIVVDRSDYGNGVQPATPVLVSPVQTIYAEYRTWIINGKVVTASSYKQAGALHTKLDVSPEVVDFAENCARIWSPEKAFCLDVCETPEGLRIVEPNTINFAGFYSANIGKLVAGIEGILPSQQK